MLSVNKIILIGNLGRDAETRFTTGNTEICNFSIATTHSYKVNEDWKNETTWHNITAFKVSEYVRKSLLKGEPVYVEGRISKREYTDKEGIKRYSVDVIADKIIPLSKPEARDDSSESSQKDAEFVKEPEDDNLNQLPF